MALAGVTVRDALDSALVPLRAAGVDSPSLDAELLLAAALDVDRARLRVDPDRALDGPATRAFQASVRRRAIEREPLAYVLGEKGFRHLLLRVDPRVLIPRPETEHLVEAALTLPLGGRVVDVGTGSGAVALALKQERPDLDVVAVDVDAGALSLARENAAGLGLDVRFVEADLLDGVEGPFDAVVSNPPYVATGDWPGLAPEIVRHEPRRALLAGEDGLDVVRRLVPQAAAVAPWVALEIGAGQAPEVAELMRAAGLERVGVVRDLAGIERIVVGSRS